MSKKQLREDFFGNEETNLDNNGIMDGFCQQHVKVAPGFRSNGRPRRTLSTKSAHFTSLPLNVSFLSATEQQKYNVLKPYFPYSVKMTSSIRQNRAQKLQNLNEMSKSEHSLNRLRRESSKSGRPETTTKSMPFLVPRTAHSSRSNNKSLSPERLFDSNGNKVDKRGIKPKPLSAMSTSSSSQHAASQVQNNEKYGEIILMGSGKVPGIPPSSIALAGSKVQVTKERVQVSRTKEEKEKNPECIRLDKNGIRIFPDIGGGENATLKLLSLQHNLITRLENVQLLSQLVVLDLYDNRIERITGLQGLPSLRVLLLGKNRIKRIEGLECLKRLEILDLHGNQLRYVDNLGPLTSLRVLNLAGNLLRNIRNLGPYGMSSLTELNLKRNRIKNLEGLQKAPHIKRLLLANNDLQSISSLAPLRKLFFLRELVIDPNPLINPPIVGTEYNNQLLTLFPNLTTLDRNVVSEEMKTSAKVWHKKKLHEEEMRKQEEAKRRDEMEAAIGPAGSREQVIYQARQRWESLKNYVKNTNGSRNENSGIDLKGRGKMKSVKSVVKAVTNEKPKPTVLYPPATLDLEDFPDGHLEFDKTESLLSKSKEKSSEASYKPNSITNHHPRPAFLLPSCSSLEDVLELSPEEDVNANNRSHTTPKLNRVENKPKDPLDNNFLSIQSEQKDIKPAATYSPHLGELYSSKEIKHIITFSGNETEKAGGQIKSSEPGSNGNDTPTQVSVDGAKETLTKVAVVKPLIRDDFVSGKSSTGITIEPLIPLVTNNFDNKIANKNEIHVIHENETDNIDVLQVSTNISETDKRFTAAGGVSNVEENNTVKICQIGVTNKESQMSKLFNENPQCDQVQSENINSKNSSTTDKAITSDITPVKAENVRSKLLKHLRSISLDSYPHQVLKSEKGGQEDETHLISDAEDVEEDEDEEDDIEILDYDCEADDAFSTTTTGTSVSTPRKGSTIMLANRGMKSWNMHRKQIFPRTKSQRIKLRERAVKLLGEAQASGRSSNTTAGNANKRVNSSTGARMSENNTLVKPPPSNRALRRCDSAISLSTTVSSTVSVGTGSMPQNANKVVGPTTGNEAENADGNTPLRKQGVDYLVEIEGKILNVFGQGGLRHAFTAFTPNVTCHVCTAKFHYISYDSIIPFFGKLRQVFPALEHFHFRANNICLLAQLDALSELRGLFSLVIAKEGNPIVSHEAWAHYASYRLSHWGLQAINGKEICSEYRGGLTPTAQAREFESLGFLALSCLPQTALTPLAKRLHMLHCFCCCSPSTSSDESSKPQKHPTVTALSTSHGMTHQSEHASAASFCTAWDDDPVLLDVIGKEALVYCPPSFLPDENRCEEIPCDETNNKIDKSDPAIANKLQLSSVHETRRSEMLGGLIQSGVEIVEKVDKLEKIWPKLMTEVIQEMIMDFRFMDSYMKKELKKAHDITLISHHHSGQQHQRKYRH